MSRLSLPPGTKVTEKLPIPDGDIKLLSGAKLLKQGQSTFATTIIHWYQASTGIRCGVSLDHIPEHGGDLLHVSCSRKDRLPSWEELGEVKAAIFGDVDVCMILPKEEDYVNLHNFCFHLWQMPRSWGIR